MLKLNGDPGQLAPARMIGISYECIARGCDHKCSIKLAIPLGCPGVQIPEYHCPKCKGLPLLAKSIPADLAVPRIVAPIGIPVVKS